MGQQSRGGGFAVAAGPTGVDDMRGSEQGLGDRRCARRSRAVDRVRSEQAASRRDLQYGTTSVERPADNVIDAAISGDERRRVTACLEGLTEVQRECIELAYYGGLTYVEVSERLAANLATVKSRMRDALRSLRNCLGVR